jgi:hypothetical protein
MKGSGSLVAAGTALNPTKSLPVTLLPPSFAIIVTLLSALPSELPAQIKLRPSDGKIVDTCDLSLAALTALRL